jgi:large subunit ribosomal protein L29
MENTVIRELSNEELSEKLAEVRLKFSKMKLNHAVSPLENPMELKHTRKLVARLLTEKTKRSKAVN